MTSTLEAASNPVGYEDMFVFWYLEGIYLHLLHMHIVFGQPPRTLQIPPSST